MYGCRLLRVRCRRNGMRERRRAHRLLCMRRDDRLSHVRDGRYRLVYGYRLLYVRRHRLGMRKVRQRHRRVGRRRDVRLLRRADGRRLSDAGRGAAAVL